MQIEHNIHALFIANSWTLCAWPQPSQPCGNLQTAKRSNLDFCFLFKIYRLAFSTNKRAAFSSSFKSFIPSSFFPLEIFISFQKIFTGFLFLKSLKFFFLIIIKQKLEQTKGMASSENGEKKLFHWTAFFTPKSADAPFQSGFRLRHPACM